MRLDGSFVTVRGNMALAPHPMSVLFKYPPKWVVFHEVLETTKAFIRDGTAIEPQWLTEAAPHFYVFVGAKAEDGKQDGPPAKQRRTEADALESMLT
mmetsp:Transcript_17106/g.37079  ORF Transcript_17106/g.37079 Transcript_17106/m.37079 type:complete len:97 (-) Transcript_17106:253-543(-)